MSYRVGHGYDIHRLSPGRRLVLGGVHIPFDKGLEGHSDADCLTHAIADAILGAAGLPDIGHYFPDDDPATADIDSQKILERAVREAAKKGFRIENVDSMVIAESPILKPHISDMQTRLAKTLGIDADAVGIKATTNEKLGEIGRDEAIAASAVCLLAGPEPACL